MADRPLPTHLLLSTADELLAYGALRAAQMSVREATCLPRGLSTHEVATHLRQAPRCTAAVAAGGYLGVALSISRETAYAMIRTIFIHVPYRSDLHPVVLVVAGRAGLIVEPRWLSWAVARSEVEPHLTAAALISAANRAFGSRVARELWAGFVEPALFGAEEEPYATELTAAESPDEAVASTR